MPQTLLALLAVFSAGILTLSQVESQHHTVEAVVRDQFELAVAGTLLDAMEFVDSRAFDAASTPARLRARYGLPATMSEAERDTISFDDLTDFRPEDFSTVDRFGGAPCYVADPLPATDGCDDVDDISGNPWQPVDLETPDGSPLPVEVKVDVTYVEAADSDTPVDYRTFHKRVEIRARTTVLRRRDGGVKPLEVSLSRVLSFDPKVAAEYLRRAINVNGEGGETCDADVGEWNRTMTALRAALDHAKGNRSLVSQALASAQDALSQAQSAQASADAAAASAQSALQSAQGARDAAASVLSSAQSALTSAQGARTAAATAKTVAEQRVGQAERSLDGAQQATVTTAAALDAAQATHADAVEAQAEAEAERDHAYDVALDAQQVQSDAYDRALVAYEQATYVDKGKRKFRSSSWEAYFYQKYNAYVVAFNDFDAKRTAFYDAAYAATDARDEAEAAAQDVADAEAAVDAAADAVASANAELANARTAVDAARTALAAAEAAVGVAQSKVASAESDLAGVQATYAAAAAAAAAAAQAAAAAASATAAAQSGVAAATADWQRADDAVTDAQRDVDDHQSSYPQCEAA